PSATRRSGATAAGRAGRQPLRPAAYEIIKAEDAQSGSSGALPRRSPLRTVRATHRGTRLKQAARVLRVEVRVSCAGGRGAPAGRMRARGGFGHRWPGRAVRGGRGSWRLSPGGGLAATTVPTAGGTGVADRR